MPRLSLCHDNGLMVTPYADQVLHLASGVCTVGSIKLSYYIKHEEAGRYKNIEAALDWLCYHQPYYCG